MLRVPEFIINMIAKITKYKWQIPLQKAKSLQKPPLAPVKSQIPPSILHFLLFTACLI
jgi:hypothetical protein